MKIQSKLERCSLKQNLVFELDKKNAAEAQRKKSSAGDSIYLDSKLLAPVVCFADQVQTSFWAILAEQHALYTRFLPRPARKESNVPKLKSS